MGERTFGWIMDILQVLFFVLNKNTTKTPKIRPLGRVFYWMKWCVRFPVFLFHLILGKN